MCGRFCQWLRDQEPPYAVLWLSEPDHTGHQDALGSPAHRLAIAAADANVARVLREVRQIDPSGQRVLFAACSDHGMQTIRRQIDLIGSLVQAGFKSSRDSHEIVVAPQGTSAVLYFAAHARPLLDDVAAWLKAQDFAGQVVYGEALASVGLPSDAPVAIAISLAGDDEANRFGVSGRSDTVASPLGADNGEPGHGEHGGLAAYEQSPFLALHGAGFARERPGSAASLIDLAPTFLAHLHLPATGMDGVAL
jgi:hypothetical protein